MNNDQPRFLGFRNSESEKKTPSFIFETSNDPDSANKNKLLLLHALKESGIIKSDNDADSIDVIHTR